jgi:hypothetical protein
MSHSHWGIHSVEFEEDERVCPTCGQAREAMKPLVDRYRFKPSLPSAHRDSPVLASSYTEESNG